PAHVDYRDFEIGVPSVINMERAVEQCAKTILVFTPDWVNSEWTQFEGLMLQTQDPIGLRKRILPLMLADCALPPRLKIFTYADFKNKNDWDSQFERLIAQVKKDFAAAAPTPPKYPPLDEKNIDITRLPKTEFELFGRQQELTLLDQAWESANTNVISFVAFGGVGKTTLINKWVEKMRWDNYRGSQKVFAWSFYSQGTNKQVTSADLFINTALQWFGDQNPQAGSPWDKGKRLADLVRQQKTLLMLDGMEPLQSGYNFEKGKIKDAALSTLVTELAKSNNGLCVITTHENVAEIDRYPATCKQINLEQISEEAGSALLRVRRVQGSEEELQRLSRAFGNHALAINLLAEYLRQFEGHPAKKGFAVPDLNVPEAKGRHARRLMEAFAQQFGNGADLEFLQILG
ncbi:MAG: TIR domain-containing protein, partial [bacterium]